MKERHSSFVGRGKEVKDRCKTLTSRSKTRGRNLCVEARAVVGPTGPTGRRSFSSKNKTGRMSSRIKSKGRISCRSKIRVGVLLGGRVRIMNRSRVSPGFLSSCMISLGWKEWAKAGWVGGPGGRPRWEAVGVVPYLGENK